MAYPAGVSLAVITTGHVGDFFGDDEPLIATVTPVLGGTSHIVHQATGTVLAPTPRVFRAVAGAGVSISVPHVDQAGWLDAAAQAYTMWAYKVDVTIGQGRGRTLSWTKNVQPLVGQALIDLDLVGDGPIGEPLSAPRAVVTSIDEMHGAVDLSGRYVGKNEIVVNVKDHGAVGDGVANDDAAIQAAQTAAAYPARALYFPAGTYNYTTPLTARIIVGADRQKTILQYQGTGNAVENGGAVLYHRRMEHLTLRGTSTTAGVGLNLDSSPAGRYVHLIVDNFGTGINFARTYASSALYNVFDDVTVSNVGTGVLFDGLAHENRFNNFRINHATTGLEFISGGRNVLMGSAIENCITGMVIRDSEPGSNLTRGNVILASRFEFCTTNWDIKAGVEYTVLIGNRPVGGTNADNGTGTVKLNANGQVMTAPGAVFTQPAGSTERPIVINNGGSAYSIDAGNFRVYSNGNVATPTLFAPSSFADSRLQLTSSGATFDRQRADANPVVRFNQINAGSTGNVAEFQKASTVMARISGSGHLGVQASMEPTDVKTGEAVLWVDTQVDPPRLMIAVKNAAGTITSTPA